LERRFRRDPSNRNHCPGFCATRISVPSKLDFPKRGVQPTPVAMPPRLDQIAAGEEVADFERRGLGGV
jgi:hypothetical protein